MSERLEAKQTLGDYEILSTIKTGGMREVLMGRKQGVFGFEKLVAIKTIRSDLRKHEDLKKLFSEFEFSSMLAVLGDGSEETSKTTEPLKKKYETVLTEAAFNKWIKKLKKNKIFALYLETTSLRPVQARAVGISFSCNKGEACYIPLGHSYLGMPDQLGVDWVFDKLKPILEDPKIKKVGQNIKYDYIVLKNEGIDLRGIVFDTMLASYLLNPSSRGHNMDALALEHLGHTTIKYKDLVGTASKEIGFDEVEVERATDYAAEDADITWRLYEKLSASLKGEDFKIFEKLELPLLEAVSYTHLTLPTKA